MKSPKSGLFDLLEAAEKGEAYDLLLCDVYMKEENGIEIAKKDEVDRSSDADRVHNRQP